MDPANQQAQGTVVFLLSVFSLLSRAANKLNFSQQPWALPSFELLPCCRLHWAAHRNGCLLVTTWSSVETWLLFACTGTNSVLCTTSFNYLYYGCFCCCFGTEATHSPNLGKPNNQRGVDNTLCARPAFLAHHECCTKVFCFSRQDREGNP